MRPAIGAALLLLALACQGPTVKSESDAATALRDVPAAALQKLTQKRIYFGHQSVGVNIFEGLEALQGERPELRFRFVDARTPDAYGAPAFGHGPIGKNEDPLAKIQDFADAVEKRGLGARADIALFKFCYVDFPPGTDVARIFDAYRSTHARLRATFPGVKFVHVTSPLTVVQSGPKALVKRILGRPLGGADANVVRERFNELLRAEYGGREPLFDLAAVEATRPDGRAMTFEHGGKTYRALAPEYASDGKHLNALGSRWAAAHLLATLASVAD